MTVVLSHLMTNLRAHVHVLFIYNRLCTGIIIVVVVVIIIIIIIIIITIIIIIIITIIIIIIIVAITTGLNLIGS